MRIKIGGIEDALRFSRIAEKFDEDVDVTDGHYTVDGKSQIGLLMICTSDNPLDAKILTDDMVLCAKFRNEIIDFLVTGE